MRILVAEDDRSSRMVTVRLLERLGHAVVPAEDGEEAWLLISRGGKFDMVISDWMMPKLDGRRLCQRVRRRENRCGVSYTYLVLLTAMTDRDHMLAGFGAGADDFLHKPLDEAELVARLRVGERIIALEKRLGDEVEKLQGANRKLHADLKAAAAVQDSMLPRELPPDDRVRFAWDYLPCEELAGDILNIVPLTKDKYGVYVLDVSGHGVAAALMSVTVSRVLSNDPMSSLLLGETAEQDVTPPGRVLALLNERYPIDANSGMRFFTIAYGILDAAKGTFRYASAGHPPVLVCRGGKSEYLTTGGPAIGIIPDWGFEEAEIEMDPSTRVVVYSDGLIENPNARNRQYGYDRFAELICKTGSCSFDRLTDTIVHEARTWSKTAGLEDDLSVLVFGMK